MKKLLSLCLICLAVLSAGAKETPWSAWRNAYTEFENGEKLRDSGDYLNAVRKFKKALELYEFVRQQRPDWNQKVILQRIADCRREVGKIEGFLTPVTPTAATPRHTSGVSAAPKKAAPVAKIDTPEVAALKQKLADQELELQTLRQREKSRRDLESEIALLIRDQHLAREKQTMLEEKLRQAQAKNTQNNENAQKQLQDQLLKSRMECETLKGKIVDLESQLKKANAEAEKYLGQRKFAESAVQAAQEKLLRQERETADIRRTEEENWKMRDKLEKELAELQKVHARTAADLEETKKSLAVTQEKMRTAAASNEAGGKVLAEENRVIQEKFNALQLRYDQLDEAFKSLRQRAGANQTLAEQMKNLAERSESARRMLEKQQASLEKQLKALRTETTDQMAEISTLKAHTVTLENNLKSAIAQRDVLTERLRQRDAADYRGAADIAAKRKEWESEREKLQQAIATHKGEIAKQEKLLADKEAQLKTLAQSRDQIVAEKTALAQEIARLSAVEKQLDQLQRNFNAAQKELQSGHAQLQIAQKEHQELLALRQNIKQIDALKLKCSDAERLAAELADANADLRAQLAEALKLKAEVEKLRAEAVQIPELRSTIERLKKLNQELAKYRDLEKELAAARQKIITLEPLAEKLAASEQQLRENQQKIAELQQLLTEGKKDFAARQEELAAAGKCEKEALTQKLIALQAEKSAADAAVHRAEEALRAARSNGENTVSAAAHAALQKEFTAAQKSLAQVQLQLANTTKELQGTEQKNRLLQAEIDQLRIQVGKLQKMESDLAQLAGKAKLAGDEIAKLRELNAVLIKNQTSGKEVELLKSQLAEAERFRQEVDQLRKLNAALRRENKELQLAVLRPAQSELLWDPMPSLPTTPEDLVAAGMRAEKEKRLSTAIWNYENALKKDPDHAFAAKRLGILLLSREQFERAAAVLKIASRLIPKDREVAIAAARANNADQHYGSALVYLEPYLKNARPELDVLLAAAEAYAGSGKRAKSEELLQLAILCYQPDPTPSLALARLLAEDPAREEESILLYERLRVSGAPPDPKLETRFAGKLDERRELAHFLNTAAEEAATRNDWATVVWYRRQATELKRNEIQESAQLAFARYMNGETAAALEELSLHRASVEGELIAALCHLRDRDLQAFQASLARAKNLNKGQIIELAPQWRQLLLELKKSALQENGKTILQFIR